MVKDMTRGNPLRLIVLFTLPLLLGNVFQQFYNFADTLIVGRTLGENALGAVGSTGAVCFLVFGVFFGITSGCTVITAQRFGAKDYNGVRRSVATSTIISAVITVVLTLLCTPLTRPLLHLLNSQPEHIELASAYLTVIFLGIAGTTFYNLLAGFIRALGDSRTPLFFLIVACILNIVLDFLFILGFGWGVTGAAVATVLAQVLSGAACMVFVVKRFPLMHLRRSDWKWDWGFAREHLSVAIPMALQFGVTAIGVVILQSALNKLGATVINAFGAAYRIDQLAVQPMISIGVAMATYVAQNYGAGYFERIRVGVRQGARLNVATSVVGAAVVIGFGTPLIGMFFDHPNPETVKTALTYLGISAFFYPALGLLFVYRNALQGMGKALVTFWAGVIELVVRCVGAFWFIGWAGFTGACLISPIAWVGGALLMMVYYYGAIRRLKRPARAQQPCLLPEAATGEFPIM